MARDLPIPGREANGIYFAMDYLEQNNRKVAGDIIPDAESIEVKGKKVLVIGGGDTGSDCIGTSNRLGAESVQQIEIMPMPPDHRSEDNPWPLWPFILRTSTSHEEGVERQWNVLTKKFLVNEDGFLEGISLVNVQWEFNETKGRSEFQEVKGTERAIPCDLAFLAIGFVHPEHGKMMEDLGVEIDNRGNVVTQDYQTSNPKVFAAGDMRRGQSLVVWAISEGREAAERLSRYFDKSGVKDNKGYSRILEKKSESILTV